MEHIVTYTRLGESMRDRFLKEASEFPYGRALFLVPNLFFRNLVRKTGLVKTATIDAIPREILRTNGRENGKVLISRYTQRKIVEEVIAALAAQNKLPYFQGLADKKGFREGCLQLIEELETQKVPPEEFSVAVEHWEREAAKGGRKDREMAGIYTAYQELMQQRGLSDLSGIYEEALTVLSEEDCSVPWDQLYFSEFNELNGMQKDLVRALMPYCSISFGLFWDEKRPELSAATRQLQEDLVGLGFAAVRSEAETERPEDLRFFTGHWQGAPVRPAEAQHFFLREAASPDSEIKFVLSDIKAKLQQGVSTKEMVVLVRNLQDYQGLGRYFEEYGIPSTLPDVTDLAGQPLPDFLSKMFEAAMAPEDLEAWKALYRTTLAGFLWRIDKESLDRACVDRYMESVFAYRGLAAPMSEGTGAEAFLDELMKPHTAGQWHQLLAGQLDAWNPVRRWGDLHREGKVTLEQVRTMAHAEEMVRQFIDGMDTVFDQCGLRDEEIGIATLYDYWAESLKGAVTLLRPGCDEGVPVLEASDIQGVSIPYVYLLGVRDGVFPYIPRESWLYSDQERQELSRSLGVPISFSAQQRERDNYFFASAVALATKEVHLSWYSDEEGGPSCYIDMLRRFFTRESLPVAEYTADVRSCRSRNELIGLLAEAPLVGDREKAWLREVLGDAFLQRKEHQDHRWEKDSPYNGKLERSKMPLHLSASQLNTFVTCPFRYLFTHIWGLDVPAERTPFPEANVVGTLIHTTLARFMGRHLQEKLYEQPLPKLKEELEKDLRDVFEGLLRDGSIPRTAFTSHIRENYVRMLEAWLVSELDYEAKSPNGMLPAYVEKAFGRGNGGWPAIEAEVDGMPVSFSGQVDRIDSNGKEYLIMDYKTGGHATQAEIENGKDIQLPLYVEATEKSLSIPREAINGAVYNEVRKGKRSGGFWSRDAQDRKLTNVNRKNKDLDEIVALAGQTVNEAIRRMWRGDFAVEPGNKKYCTWCPARDVCRVKENAALGFDDMQEEKEHA
jgi:ATP-dependent helicase/nuclease subunit B